MSYFVMSQRHQGFLNGRRYQQRLWQLKNQYGAVNEIVDDLWNCSPMNVDVVFRLDTKQEAHGPWHSAWDPTRPLTKVPEVPHTLSFYYPRALGSKLSYFYSTGNCFRDTGRVSELLTGFQNWHIWAWNLAMGQSARYCTYTLFLPKGSKLRLFSLYGQRFSRYGMIFKIAIFGHETWQLARVPEVAHILSLYPRGQNWAYFRSTGSGFRDMGWFSRLPFWAWNLAIGQSSRNCTCTS